MLFPPVYLGFNEVDSHGTLTNLDNVHASITDNSILEARYVLGSKETQMKKTKFLSCRS